jgi:hypothetical protein
LDRAILIHPSAWQVVAARGERKQSVWLKTAPTTITDTNVG